MLFSSTEFLFGFLPLTVAGFYLARFIGGDGIGITWLVLASLFFYAWWNPALLPLIVASILVNYGLGRVLAQRPAHAILVLGVTFNLALLGYFKYAGFLVASADHLLGTGFTVGDIVLPLAISFFTFQQIAYLVDTYGGRSTDPSFLNYCLFVTFFPQLIAGPIVHHGEMIPQFRDPRVLRFDAQRFAIGASIFLIGLYKKTVLADGIAPFADRVFSTAAAGAPTFLDSWSGAMAYTFQIYFDFSGYSDMAIGLAFAIGIRLPLNFDSPYKASSIIDFWRRWHITLSRFLRDYLYVPLGGNRKGRVRRYVNLMVTMLLGGLWHGAGWTFVFWGGLHGLYLVINHLWRRRGGAENSTATSRSCTGRIAGTALTFLSVVVAWVFFRAEDWPTAIAMLSGMIDVGSLPDVNGLIPDLASAGFVWLVALALFVWCLPNTMQLFIQYAPALVERRYVAAAAPATLMRLRGSWIVPTVVIAGLTASMVVLVRGADAPRFIYMVF